MSTPKSLQYTRDELIQQLAYLGQATSTETALFHETAAAAYGLGITDMKALALLAQEGSRTAGELKTALHLTTGAITNLIDRLERRKFVTREADPNDRRKVIVVANMQQITSGKNVYESIGSAYKAFHETLPTQELKLIVRYLQKSLELTRQEIHKLQSAQDN